MRADEGGWVTEGRRGEEGLRVVGAPSVGEEKGGSGVNERDSGGETVQG